MGFLPMGGMVLHDEIIATENTIENKTKWCLSKEQKSRLVKYFLLCVARWLNNCKLLDHFLGKLLNSSNV